MGIQNGAVLDEIRALLQEKQLKPTAATRLMLRSQEKIIETLLAQDEKLAEQAKKLDGHSHPELPKLKMLSAVGVRIVIPVGVGLLTAIASFLYGVWTHTISIVMAGP